MTGLYLAPGHGIRPNGEFDPGAVSGSVVEHTQNVLVAAAAAVALARSHYTDMVFEPNGGSNRDPNYVGSTRRANELGAAYIIEVHHNAGGGSGTETLVWTDSGATGTLGHRILGELVAALHLPNRGVQVRKDLYLLRETRGVACIPEIAFVDGDKAWMGTHGGYTRLAGEAIAKAFLAQVGRPYVR